MEEVSVPITVIDSQGNRVSTDHQVYMTHYGPVAVDLIGADVAGRVRDAAIAVYQHARDYAADCGIIVADTKFEFAIDGDGELVLIDEVLTPDSSRFWPAETYAPGHSPESFDKQFVRNHLESIGWNKRPPAPELPPDITAKTAEKYAEAKARLVGAA